MNTRPSERRAIWVFVTIVVLLLILSAYGCFSGAWDNAAVVQ